MKSITCTAMIAALLTATTTLCAPAQAESVLRDVELRPLAGREPVALHSEYGGKVLLLVNTASKCGLTPQYEGLEALHQRYGDQGFAVLGFPSGDFMNQEFEDEAEIAEFCTLTYGVQFPMFERVAVTGEEATVLFQRLAQATGNAPAWNFHKYLVNREGEVVADFGSRTVPGDEAITSAIEAELAR